MKGKLSTGHDSISSNLLQYVPGEIAYVTDIQGGGSKDNSGLQLNHGHLFNNRGSCVSHTTDTS